MAPLGEGSLYAAQTVYGDFLSIPDWGATENAVVSGTNKKFLRGVYAWRKAQGGK